MCETTSAIHRAKAEQKLTNMQVADRMGSVLGHRIDESQVQKYFTGTTGIPVDSIGAFIGSLGFKLAKHDDEVVEHDELAALVLLAEKGIRARRHNTRERQQPVQVSSNVCAFSRKKANG